MFRITKNTYPENMIKHKVGTLCNWRTDKGHLLLSECNSDGTFVEKEFVGFVDILTKGQIYALDGNLLSGKTEPERFGLVAKFVKNGWYLEIEYIK